MSNCKKRSFILGRSVASILAMCMLMLPFGLAEEEVPELLEPVGVKLDTATAYIGEFSKTAVYDASVVPHVEELAFTQSGYIDELHIFIGEEFKKGDVIATLNYDAQQQEAESLRVSIARMKQNHAYEEAFAKIDMSILNVELNRLMSASPIDQKAVELKKLDIEQAQLDNELSSQLRAIELSQLENRLAVLESSFAQNVLYAPCDGRIIHCDALMPGSYVKAYDTLAYLADDSRLYIQSPYISLTNIERAHDIYAQVEGTRYEITAIPMDHSEYMSIVVSGGTLLSDFSVDNPDETLTPGKYAAVFLKTNYIPDALIIPANTLYSDSEGRYVYIDEDGERVRRQVTIGLTNDWYAQVLSGIEEGDVVYVKD